MATDQTTPTAAAKPRLPAITEIDSPTSSDHLEATDDFDYLKRAQWLRAAILGANDGLVSTASLMLGIGAVKSNVKVMILTGFAGLIAGACSMAIGEFVSVYSQLDVEMAQIKREKGKEDNDDWDIVMSEKERPLPKPLQAAMASALAFSMGSTVPLLAASFIKDYKVRIGVVVAAVSLAMLAFGWLGAVLGKAPAARSSVRVVLGGWAAMAATFGLTKLMASRGL